MKIENIIENLIDYSLKSTLIEEQDVIYIRNQINSYLNITDINVGKVSSKYNIYDLFDQLKSYALDNGLIKEDLHYLKEIFETNLLNIVTPRPSSVISNFNNDYAVDKVKATTNYYNFSKATNYIKVNSIKKNINYSSGGVNITINLSKPELSKKDMELMKSKQSSYPSCLLCVENEGYIGRSDHPARATHRIIPIDILDEVWYFQYSPYAYFNEHAIVFPKTHRDMKVELDSFSKMIEFSSKIPHYFFASNADLDLVGGSISNHIHFQAGREVFPIENSKVIKTIKVKKFNSVSINVIDWKMSTVKLVSTNKKELADCANYILEQYKGFSSKEDNIIAKTDKLHNTTSYAVRNNNGEYSLYLIFRNNRKDNDFPEGIFHSHKENHHIKKENIGIIEACGLCVLPGRLDKELSLLTDCLKGNKNIDNYNELSIHKSWFDEIKEKYDNTDDFVLKEVCVKFNSILENAKVFKTIQSFDKFLNSLL